MVSRPIRTLPTIPVKHSRYLERRSLLVAVIMTSLPFPYVKRLARQSTGSSVSTINGEHDMAVSPPASPTERSFLDNLADRLRSKSCSPPPGVKAAAPTSNPISAQRLACSRPSTPTTKRHSRSNSGTYTHCGRHGNEWLFNNFSVTETVKGMLDNRKGS